MRGPNSLVIRTLVMGLLLGGWLEVPYRATAARVDDRRTLSHQHVDSTELKDRFGDISETARGLEESGDNYDDEDGDQDDLDESDRNPLAEIDEAHPGGASHERTLQGGAPCGIGFAQCKDGSCYLLKRRCDGVADCLDSSDEHGCFGRRPLPPDTFTTESSSSDPFNSNTRPYHLNTPPTRPTSRPHHPESTRPASNPYGPASGDRYATSTDRGYPPGASFGTRYPEYPSGRYTTTTNPPITTTFGYPGLGASTRHPPRYHPGTPDPYPSSNVSLYYPSSSDPYYPGSRLGYPTTQSASDVTRGSYPSSVVTHSTNHEMYRPDRYPTTGVYENAVTTSYWPTSATWYPPQIVPDTTLDVRKGPESTTHAPLPSTTTTTHPPFVVRQCLPRKEFRCTSGQCVPRWQKCDYVIDCYDRSDEQHCKPCDDRIHFTCANGQCVGKSLVCDKSADCRDKSDEAMCKNVHCSPNEFRCGDGSCIPRSARCDGQRDCRDGQDEGPHCPQPPAQPIGTPAANHSRTARPDGMCRPGEFRCGDGSCIHGGRRCNRVIDCRHGEDERGCEADRRCAASEFKCPQDGLCIRQNQLCDEILDCTGGDDEINCNHHRGGPGHSPGQPKDVDTTHHHSKHPNRPDENSDEERRREQDRRWREMQRRRIEEQQRQKAQQQYEQELARRRAEEAQRNRQHWEQKEREQDEEERRRQKEESAKKVDDAVKWIEDALKEADNGVDTGAGSSRHGQCLPGEFACRTHDQCVAAGLRCNRRPDCFDGSDEANCCASGELQCGDGTCVPAQNRCDGRRHCLDGADEMDCPDQRRCRPTQFTCTNGQCIERGHRCDGKLHCADASDENGCSVSDIDVRVYPPFQNETVGHNVVIRCRDEGPRRLKVRWARADGRPLKSGHTDHRGRLTLHRVTVDDAGVYLCIPLAVDGQELRPGQKSATLIVTARVYPLTHAPFYPFSRTIQHEPRYYEQNQRYYRATGFGQTPARRQRRQHPVAAASGSDTLGNPPAQRTPSPNDDATANANYDDGDDANTNGTDNTHVERAAPVA